VDSLIAENFLAEVDHNVTLTRLEPVELLHDVENHPIVGLVQLNEETTLEVLKEIFDRELAILWFIQRFFARDDVKTLKFSLEIARKNCFLKIEIVHNTRIPIITSPALMVCASCMVQHFPGRRWTREG
jgi:hypothetical protein